LHLALAKVYTPIIGRLKETQKLNYPQTSNQDVVYTSKTSPIAEEDILF